MTDKKRDRLLKSFFKHQEFNQVNQKYKSGKDGFRINDYIGRWYMDELILNVGKKRFYLLVCVKIFTKYCLVEINTRPSRAEDVKRIIDKIKNVAIPLNFIKTDNAPIFNVISEEGILHYKSPPYDLYHNSPVERMNLTIRSKVKRLIDGLQPRQRQRIKGGEI